MAAYYNEFDPQAAEWLRNLIAAGHIAPGDVDERSIEDVTPDDLINYTQCHFFAGVGVWSYALRRAGWPDDIPIWTGSCPCQPFSSAGKSGGFADERHLWPAFYWLIKQCGPAIIIGEQVASKATGPWFDLVQADLEALGYAFGCIPFPSAGVGAPHIRDRAFWVGDAKQHGDSAQEKAAHHRQPEADRPADWPSGCGVSLGGLADSARHRFDGRRNARPSGRAEYSVRGILGGLGNTSSESSQRDAGSIRCPEGKGDSAGRPNGRIGDGHSDAGNSFRLVDANGGNARRGKQRLSEKDGSGAWAGNPGVGIDADAKPAAGPTNGFWRDADWLFCRDGKWRPVEPGSFPLANVTTERVGRMQPRLASLGFSESDIKRILGRRNSTLADAGRNRVTRLKGYGNAINGEAAQAFIESWLETKQ